MPHRSCVAGAVFLCGLAVFRGWSAEPIPHNQDAAPGPALTPAEAIARMELPPGFQVELVAAEPDIVNPVAMTFDERGRIWITESLDYPRLDAGPGRDRIKILEDTDQDGQVDRTSIFADGLNIPSGIAVGHGGVWVANAPDILYLRDTDGDDRADTRQVVVTGFGRDDTHELPNSLNWGPDGWLYGLNGVFNHSHVTYPPDSPWAKRHGKGFEFTAAMFRIHPRTREFQVFAEGTSNPWGIAWDGEGEAFISACVIDHLWHITESGYYHRQAGAYPPFTWKIESIVGHTHQKAAYCGIEYLDTNIYPEPYRQCLVMGNIHGNCINADKIERRGATYRGTPSPDLLVAHDAWFMPVSQKMGPDGCLYILDWYDRYHCYQDAMRDGPGIDRLRGRLYRIRYGQAPRPRRFNLLAEDDHQLVQHLQGTNAYFRRTSQRILQERGTATSRLIDIIFAKEPNISRAVRLHAYWSLAGSGQLTADVLTRLLADPDPTLRAWGVRSAGDSPQLAQGLTSELAALARDPSPDVRLQLAIAARKITSLNPLDTLCQVQQHDDGDPLISHIVWQNLYPLLNEHAARFVTHASRWPIDRSASSAQICARALEVMLAGEPSTRNVATAWFEKLARHPQENQALLIPLLHAVCQPEYQAVVAQIAEQLGSRHREIVTRLLADTTPHDVRRASLLLGAQWQSPLANQLAGAWLIDNKQDSATRIAALQALLVHSDSGQLQQIVPPILAQVHPESQELRAAIIPMLAPLPDPWIAQMLIAQFPQYEPELQARAVDVLTQRAEWGAALLDAVSQQKIPAVAVQVRHARQLMAFPQPSLQQQVTQLWGSIRPTDSTQRQQAMKQVETWMRERPGDPLAGEKIFFRVCASCHKLHGQGTEVGPDLTLNGRNAWDQLLSNVLDPNLVVGSAYQTYQLVTAQGRVLTGLLVEDAPGHVKLKVSGGQIETISRPDIEALERSSLSLMPENLEAQLQPQELVDLFSYLSLDRAPADPSARRIPGTPTYTNVQ